jgi:hypothetical protein
MVARPKGGRRGNQKVHPISLFQKKLKKYPILIFVLGLMG